MARRYFKVTRLPSSRDIGDRFLSGMAIPDKDRSGNISISKLFTNGISGTEDFQAYVSYATPVALLSTDGLRLYIANYRYSVSTGQHMAKLSPSSFGFHPTGRAIWRDGGRWAPSGNIEFTEYKRSAWDRDKYAGIYADKNGFAECSEDEMIQHNTSRRGYGTSVITKEPKVKAWYKVVGPELEAISGGHYEYEIGKWTEPVTTRLCHSGYHATNRISKWGGANANNRVLRLAVKGFGGYDGYDAKAVFRTVMPVSELTNAEINEVLISEGANPRWVAEVSS